MKNQEVKLNRKSVEFGGEISSDTIVSTTPPSMKKSTKLSIWVNGGNRYELEVTGDSEKLLESISIGEVHGLGKRVAEKVAKFIEEQVAEEIEQLKQLNKKIEQGE